MGRKFLYCILAFILGIIIAAIFLFWFFGLDFFGVGASTYKSFAFFAFFYGTLGAISGFIWPGASWVYGVCLGAPMFLLLGPLNFSDPSPLEQLPGMAAALSPFSACLGTYIGERLALRRKRKVAGH